MEFVYNVLVVLHFVGLASLLGGVIVQIRSADKGVNRAMLDGALTQLVTGILMVGIVSAGALGEAEKAELDNAKVGVKLLVVIVITILALVGRKKPLPQKGLWAAIGLLTLLNSIIAVFWN